MINETEFQLETNEGAFFAEKVAAPEVDELQEPINPTFPDSVYKAMPSVITGALVDIESNEQKDLAVLSVISCASGLPLNVSGVWDGDEIYPNVLSVISAEAASGKGIMKRGYQAIEPFEEEVERENHNRLAQYQEKQQNAETSEEIEKPLWKTIVLSADSSNAGLMERLAANEGYGAIYDTETDTLSKSSKQDWGIDSSLLRKAFMNEPIKNMRVGRGSTIKCPRFSLMISGTPQQTKRLLAAGPEDGLFSRLLFYRFRGKRLIERRIKYQYNTKSSGKERKPWQSEFLGTINTIIEAGGIQFRLTDTQVDRLNDFMTSHGNELVGKYGQEFAASAIRAGINVYKICMILTAISEGQKMSVEKTIICSDEILEAAIEMIKVLMEHSQMVLRELRGTYDAFDGGGLFYEKLSDEFRTSNALEVGALLGIERRTVFSRLESMQESGVLKKIKHGVYAKVQSAKVQGVTL